MKKLIYILLIAVIFSCTEQKQKTDKPEKEEQKDVPMYTDEQVKMKKMTCIFILDRMFEKKNGKDYVRLKTNIVNKGDKDIARIKGELVIKDDLTGTEFCRYPVDCKETIKADGRIMYITDLHQCNKDDPRNQIVLDKEPVEMNSWVSWNVEKIVFTDGSEMVMEE